MNNVIDLSTVARPGAASAQKAAASVTTLVPRPLTRRQERQRRAALKPPATETAKNSRLRDARRDAWWRAERLAQYWGARLEWESALSTAQRNGIADSASFPPVQYDRITLVTFWREAVAKQILTPAPDLLAITWKRAQLAKKCVGYLPIKAARIEQAIADDVAFLAAHPTRRSDEQAVIRRREFKAAMRQRINEVAASRGLSEAEIKPALRLKHQEIASFSKTHGVNLAWLLEGGGPMFLTAPDADRSNVRAMVREVLAEPEVQSRLRQHQDALDDPA